VTFPTLFPTIWARKTSLRDLSSAFSDYSGTQDLLA
jgi:hypothetical protein